MTHNDWIIFFLSALPVTELRVTIPLALGLGMAPLRAVTLAVLGNLLPIIPILVLLEPLSKLLHYFPYINRLFQKVLTLSRRKGKQVEKYGVLGLLLFVAVPLPGTGAWTGAILAWLLGLNILSSALAIGLGVVSAGIIVTLASVGVLQATIVYDLEFALILFLACGAVHVIYRLKKRRTK